jgi:hypothetical protein
MNMPLRTAIGLFAALACAGCATRPIDIVKAAEDSDAVARRNHLIGCWLGDERVKDGSRRLALANKRRNGTYDITFRFIDGGAIVREQTEFGRWGLSGPIYFTITERIGSPTRAFPTDLEDGVFYDAYEMIELTGEIMKYRDFSGNTYVNRKLRGACAFPSPI